ncbi:DUF1904 domain-containing protein [Clostridium brassicae]|uniref:DUF1904 domain-containing protein n=1 Tax=Clostridium brassicae TaxID=2999072 RepID=A0ABT4DI06_9CLOT|nr:DUF1904 domain-containing protein [Clostridium brassicae]MCY6960649.1 DUF1904 domain-containing protein [Clostridium brassicae]
MPQIKIRGMKIQSICNMSKDLVDELQKVLDCPRDYFTIEHINSIFIMDGKEIDDGYPFVEVAWFDRGQEIQDKVAKIVTNKVQEQGYNSLDIMFTVFKENSYYENGEHF